jgi:hypothetical protein
MDDLSNRLNELFSTPEGMEKIKSLVNLLSSSSGGGPKDEPGPPPGPGGGYDPAVRGGGDPPGFDPDLLLKMQGAFELMKKHDPRVDLLAALRPHLSGSRQKSVDEAVNILRILSLLPLLRDKGIL